MDAIQIPDKSKPAFQATAATSQIDPGTEKELHGRLKELFDGGWKEKAKRDKRWSRLRPETRWQRESCLISGFDILDEQLERVTKLCSRVWLAGGYCSREIMRSRGHGQEQLA